VNLARQTVLVGLILSAAIVLDLALGEGWTIRGIRPDLTLAALVPIALRFGAGAGSGWGLMTGLILGAFGPIALTSIAVSRVVAGWTVGLLNLRVFRDHVLVTAGAGMIGSLIADIGQYMIVPLGDPKPFLVLAVGRSAYTAALVVPMSLFIRRVFDS